MTNECIRISRFKNGTVTVEGIVWILWEDEKNNVDNSDFSPKEEIVKELISPEANQLQGMSSDTLLSLTGMNDTTKMLFQGIRTEMTVDEQAGQIRLNLEQMASAGHLQGESFKNGITDAINTVNSQMDVKPSTDKVQGDLAQMANGGSQEAQKLASNVASEASKIPDTVKPVNQVPKIVEDAMNNANNVNKNGYTQMQQNTIDQLGNMLNDIRGKFEDMIKAMVDTVNGGVQSVDSAFMRVFNAVKNIMINLKIEVSNQMSAIRDEMSKSIDINVNSKITTQSVTLPSVEPQSIFDMSVYDTNSQARYSSNGVVAQGFKQSTSTNDDNSKDILKTLLAQNKLLNQILAKESSVNVESNLTLDSRGVAKQLAKPMKTELNNLDKRQARLFNNIDLNKYFKY